jgi:hypothetical protein
MFDHVIDRATGRIVEVCAEGSDTSRFPDTDYLVVSDPAAHDPGTDCWDPSAGKWVGIPDAELLAEAKGRKQGELLVTVNNFIAVKPDGTTRYDTNLKLNVMTAGIQAALAGQPKPSSVEAVEKWIAAVQSAYFERKAALGAATTLDELEAVDVSYDWFEARYGLAGSVLADPDVYTKDLW